MYNEIILCSQNHQKAAFCCCCFCFCITVTTFSTNSCHGCDPTRWIEIFVLITASKQGCSLEVFHTHYRCILEQIDKVYFWKRGLDSDVRCKCGEKRYLWLFQSIWVCWIQKWWIPKIIFASWPSYLHKNKMAAKIVNLGLIVSRIPIISKNLRGLRIVWFT